MNSEIMNSLKDLFDSYSSMGFKELPVNNLFREPVLESVADLSINKEKMLASLSEDIGECKRCKLHKERKNIVSGEGNVEGRIMFIGGAPHKDDDVEGRLFSGELGAVFLSLINKMGFNREDVYVSNIVRCRPVGDRRPDNEEIGACFGFLESEIEIVSPHIIMTLGTAATTALTGIDKNISELRGKLHEYRGIKVMPTFQPSYLIRNRDHKWLTWNDSVKVLKVLGIEVIH